MSWQTKGRIEIYGQGGPCDRSQVEVSHAFPPMLAGYVPPEVWEKFCNQLDVALEPAQKVKDLQFGLMVFGIVMFALFFIWGCVLYSGFDITDENWDDRFWIMFIVMGGLIIFVPLAIKLMAAKSAHEVKNVLKRICDDESNKYPQMSFQVKFETVIMGGGMGQDRGAGFQTFNYIEVNMAPSAMPQNPVPGQLPGIPMMPMMGMATATGAGIGGVYGGAMMAPTPQPVAAPGGGGSPAERLAQLEAIKGMISEQEYNTKKQEILNSV